MGTVTRTLGILASAALGVSDTHVRSSSLTVLPASLAPQAGPGGPTAGFLPVSFQLGCQQVCLPFTSVP